MQILVEMCSVLRMQKFNYMTSHSFQVASSALGLGPQVTMQVAERLYTQGFIRSGFAPLVLDICTIAFIMMLRLTFGVGYNLFACGTFETCVCCMKTKW